MHKVNKRGDINLSDKQLVVFRAITFIILLIFISLRTAIMYTFIL